MLIRVGPRLVLDEAELDETFLSASGPGGQNVNKVATAVQLRFDLGRNTTLPAGLKQRLRARAGRRLTQDDVIVITANRHRTQAQNRADARERLFALIRDSAPAPLPRRPTKPTKASVTRRLEEKTHRARLKQSRRIEMP